MDSVSSFDVVSASEKIPPSPMRVPPSPSKFTVSPKLSRIGSVHLTVNQALKATRNFSSSLRIGEGGFGTVYKARLENGQEVAIKRAKKVSCPSYDLQYNFWNIFSPYVRLFEVRILVRRSHILGD